MYKIKIEDNKEVLIQYTKMNEQVTVIIGFGIYTVYGLCVNYLQNNHVITLFFVTLYFFDHINTENEDH